MNIKKMRRLQPILAAASIALPLAACASAASTASSAGSPAVSADVLGTARAATGPELTVGWVTNGKSATEDTSSELSSIQAAASYINNYLGGVGKDHYKLNFVTCEDKGTDAGAQDCVNQMVSDKVPAVLSYISTSSPVYAKGFSEAGIIYTTGNDITPGVATNDKVFSITDGSAESTWAVAGLAKADSVKSVIEFAVNVPSYIDEEEKNGPLWAGYGVTKFKVAPVDIGVPDLTPTVDAALSTQPGTGMAIMVALPDQCVSIINALRTSAFSGPIFMNADCRTAQTNAAIQGGLKGISSITPIDTDPSSADYKILLAAHAKYAASTSIDGNYNGAWQVVLAFQAAMASLTGNVTPAAIDQAYTSMPPTRLPLGGGMTFQCNREQNAALPAVCTRQTLSAVYDASGNLTDFKVISKS